VHRDLSEARGRIETISAREREELAHLDGIRHLINRDKAESSRIQGALASIENIRKDLRERFRTYKILTPQLEAEMGRRELSPLQQELFLAEILMRKKELMRPLAATIGTREKIEKIISDKLAQFELEYRQAKKELQKERTAITIQLGECALGVKEAQAIINHEDMLNLNTPSPRHVQATHRIELLQNRRTELQAQQRTNWAEIQRLPGQAEERRREIESHRRQMLEARDNCEAILDWEIPTLEEIREKYARSEDLLKRLEELELAIQEKKREFEDQGAKIAAFAPLVEVERAIIRRCGTQQMAAMRIKDAQIADLERIRATLRRTSGCCSR
jgi:hypothetical protein